MQELATFSNGFLVSLMESGEWNKAGFESCVVFRLVSLLTSPSASSPAGAATAVGGWIPLKGNTLLYSGFGAGPRVTSPGGAGGKFMLITLTAQCCVGQGDILEKVLVGVKVSRCFFKTCQVSQVWSC